MALEIEAILAERANDKEHRRKTTSAKMQKSSECPDCHNAKPRWELSAEPRDERDFVQCVYCGYTTLAPGQPIHAAKEAAVAAGVSERYVSDAKRIRAEAPELEEKVKSGEMSLPEVKKEHKRQEREVARAELAAGPVASSARMGRRARSRARRVGGGRVRPCSF